MHQPLEIFLIAEDEALVAISIQWELEGAGYDVCGIAITGEEAVTKAAEQKPDLLLIDIGLAGKYNGIEAVRKILATVELQVIFMTGYAMEDIAQRTAGIPALGCIMKPFSLQHLKEFVQKIEAEHKQE